jgi:hypothetical protein
MKREHINESEEDRERLGEAFLKIAPALKVSIDLRIQERRFRIISCYNSIK